VSTPLDEARATLPRVTDWRDATNDELAAHCARAVEGRGEWTWLVVRYPLPQPTGHGYDGTATRGGVLVHLPRDIAVEVWLRGDAAIRGERWVS
jgi:hypothetical protein